MVCLTLVWGSNMVSIKILVEGMAPLMGAALRGVVALGCLTLLGLARRETLVPLDRISLHGAANGIIFGLEFALVYEGSHFTNAGHMSIFINMAPFFVAVGAHFLLVNDHLHPWKVIGLVMAFVGVVCLFSDDLFITGSGFWKGDLMVLLGAMLWGSSTLYLKRMVAEHRTGFQMLYVQILVSTPFLLVLSFLREDTPFISPTIMTWSMVVYQGGFIVFLTYLMFLVLLKRYPASAVQSFTFLTPAWGVLLGVLLLGEAATPLLLLGMVLVGMGLYLVNRPRKRAGG